MEDSDKVDVDEVESSDSNVCEEDPDDLITQY